MLDIIREMVREKDLTYPLICFKALKLGGEDKTLYLPSSPEGFEISEDFILVLKENRLLGRTYGGGIFRDTYHSLDLRKGGRMPYATIGFEIVPGPKFRVMQIQSREKGFGRENLPSKWERAMFEAGINWADALGIPTVEMQKGESNRQYKKVHGRETTPEEKTRLRVRYDVTAKRTAKRRKIPLEESLDSWILNLPN